MDDTIDLLQIKIEKAKRQLSDDTLNAIAAVPWQAEIIKMRETKGYTFEQLSDLELSTELLLCGLLNPDEYPKEIEKGMGISKAATNELVEEMNKLIFSKIKEELIKNTERKNIFAKKTSEKENHTEIFKDHGIEIIGNSSPLLSEEGAGGGNSEFKSPPRPSGTPPQKGGEGTLPVPEKLELESGGEVHPMLAQKLSATVQVETVKTEHTPENITKTNSPVPPISYPKNADPYRLPPE